MKLRRGGKIEKINKKIIFVLIIGVMLHININAFAQENFYQDEKGVMLFKKEYDFISNMYLLEYL